MRIRSLLLSGILSLSLAASGWASFSGGKSEPPPPSNPGLPNETPATATGPRQEAEQIYSIAYDEIAKAKKDVAGGKSKNAEKKFKRALERGQRAVALDSTYHEAWNLVGYAARKLGDYDQAFAAYDKCLSIEPDYAPAREYLGEAWLEKNEPAKAREQLAVLERVGANEDASLLRGLIEAYEKAHPASAETATDEQQPAPADSASMSGKP